MSVHDEDEFDEIEASGWLSLNDEMRKTNTSPGSAKAFDHVLFNPATSTEVDSDFDLAVVDDRFLAAATPRREK